MRTGGGSSSGGGDRDRERGGGGGGGDRENGAGGGGGGRLSFRRRKYCKFCEEKIPYIDWKDPEALAPYVPERAKVAPRRITGTCAMHQRKLQTAIKQSRMAVLLPFTTE
jgi:small subunit ribosomal protein S18